MRRVGASYLAKKPSAEERHSKPLRQCAAAATWTAAERAMPNSSLATSSLSTYVSKVTLTTPTGERMLRQSHIPL